MNCPLCGIKAIKHYSNNRFNIAFTYPCDCYYMEEIMSAKGFDNIYEAISKTNIRFRESSLKIFVTIGDKKIECKKGTRESYLLFLLWKLKDKLPEDLIERKERADRHLKRNFPVLADKNDEEILSIILDNADKVTDSIKLALQRKFDINPENTNGEEVFCDPNCDYPEQWLDHMSKESARWLCKYFDKLKEGHLGVLCENIEDPPRELTNSFKLGMVSVTNGCWNVSKMAFRTGGLEKPDNYDGEF